MTTRFEDNRLGCVRKYLKKLIGQCYDVIMTSSIGLFKKKHLQKPTLLKCILLLEGEKIGEI